jgi:uncharacterized protein (TIRG00374 family)
MSGIAFRIPGMPAARSLIRPGVSLALLTALAWMVDLEQVGRVVAGADVSLLALMFLLLAAERLCAAWRWHGLLRVVAPAMPFWPVMRVTLVSNFVGSFLPGGVGIEVLKVHGLARYVSDLPVALSSVLLERLFGLLGLMLMVGLGLLVAPVDLPAGVLGLLGAGAILLALSGAGLLLPWPRRLMRAALAWLRLGPVMARFQHFERCLETYGRCPQALLAALVTGFLFQVLRVVTVIVGAQALGLTVDPLLFAVVVPVGLLVALMPISIGGFGPREATVALLGLAGVPPAAALALSLTREALGLATTLPGALLYARGPLTAAPAR